MLFTLLIAHYLLMAYPNYTYPTNVSNINGFFKWFNVPTYNLFWPAGLLVLFIIVTFAGAVYIPNILPRLGVTGMSFAAIASFTTAVGWTQVWLPIVFALISAVPIIAYVFSTQQ